MFYKYEFIKNKKMEELNKHFFYFIRKIRSLKKGATFKPNLYFHPTFLNTSGRVAPKGRINAEIENKFKDFFNDYKKIDLSQKQEFYNLILKSKDIHLYFEQKNNYPVLNLRNQNIKRILGDKDSFKELMESLWKYLSSNNAWEIDMHYQDFHDKLPESKMCPFCGLEILKIPILRRSDYDHLALKSRYPISSINMRNIAPSCDDCNGTFKKEKDVFFTANNVRRMFSYPFVFDRSYQTNNIEISLAGSIIPDTDVNNALGNWVINILPVDDLTQTWNQVYSIKTRYALAIKHETWMDEMKKILVLHNVKFTSHQEVIAYLNRYKNLFNPIDIKVENHLKYSYFRFLEESNNNVLYEQIKRMSA